MKLENWPIDKLTPYGKNARTHSEAQVAQITRQKGHPTNHPAMFPVALPEFAIVTYTKRGDSIYEPFCGSGTTLIAAEQTDRVCLAMEIDPGYCDVIVARWEKLTGKKAERESAV